MNVAIFILIYLSSSFSDWVGRHFILDPEKVFSNWELWRCVTYLFLHNPFSIWHILFNMIGLWFLGSELESIWGKRKFLEYYFVVGIVSGFIAAIYYFNFKRNR